MRRVISVLMIVLLACFLSSTALASSDNETNQSEPRKIRELTSLREFNTKVFQLDDGHIEYEVMELGRILIILFIRQKGFFL